MMRSPALRLVFLLVELLPLASALVVAPRAVPASSRGGACTMSSIETKAQRLVRKRLNLLSNLEDMDDTQLRKYAYALQMEVRRLVKEEKNALDFRDKLRSLLDQTDAAAAVRANAAATKTLSPEEESGLIAAMKSEGLVRYGLAYATSTTDWDKLRANNQDFEDFSDEELLAAFQASGKGISGTFGDLF